MGIELGSSGSDVQLYGNESSGFGGIRYEKLNGAAIRTGSSLTPSITSSSRHPALEAWNATRHADSKTEADIRVEDGVIVVPEPDPVMRTLVAITPRKAPEHLIHRRTLTDRLRAAGQAIVVATSKSMRHIR